LEYTYQIGGQLKSYTDPYGDQISYSHDKRGRLGTVTGTSFGGTTNYAGNPDYRAWGALKHVEYGNGQQATLTFDNRLKPISFLVNDISTPTAELFDRTYEYYADGRLKLVDEHPDGVSEFKNKYDRLFTYDHQGRVQDAKSGVEAHGETETDLFELPYRQSYTHDAFGHVASRTSKLWNYGDWDFAYTYTNNRVTNLTYSYDFDGRTTQADGVTFSYNGAGQMVETKKSAEYETTIDHDGLGKEAKRAQRTWDGEENQWNEWETYYFVYSTPLGQIITETTDTGKKKATYVVGAGTLIAKQGIDDEDEEHVAWRHRDASGLSAWSSGFGPGAGTMPREELDGMGNNVGHIGAFIPPERGATTASPFDSINFGEVLGDCELDGILVPCSMAFRVFSSGAAIPSELAHLQHDPQFRYEDIGLGMFRVYGVVGHRVRAESPNNQSGGGEGDVITVNTEEDRIWGWFTVNWDFEQYRLTPVQDAVGPKLGTGVPKNLRDLVLGLAADGKCGEVFEQLIQTSSKKFKEWQKKSAKSGKSIIETMYDSLKSVSIDPKRSAEGINDNGKVFLGDYNNDPRGLFATQQRFALITLQETIHQVFSDADLRKASERLYDNGKLDPAIASKVDRKNLYEHGLLSAACAKSDQELTNGPPTP
jgi:hypothetical protein